MACGIDRPSLHIELDDGFRRELVRRDARGRDQERVARTDRRVAGGAAIEAGRLHALHDGDEVFAQLLQ